MEQYEGIGRKEEEEHLKDCVEIIQKNVDYYQEKERVMFFKYCDNLLSHPYFNH